MNMDIHQDLAHLQVEKEGYRVECDFSVEYGVGLLEDEVNKIEDGQVPSDNRFYYHKNVLSIASLGVCYQNLVGQIVEVEYQDSNAQYKKYGGAVYKDFFEISP